MPESTTRKSTPQAAATSFGLRWVALQLSLGEGNFHQASPCLQLDAAWMAAKGGVTTVIASGKGADALLQVVAGELRLQRLYASQTSQKTPHMHPALPAFSAGSLYVFPCALVPQAMTCGLCSAPPCHDTRISTQTSCNPLSQSSCYPHSLECHGCFQGKSLLMPSPTSWVSRLLPGRSSCYPYFSW